MFCGCPTEFGAEPNTQVCPVCLGLPGSLPVANAAAIESTIRIGLALNCTSPSWCRFARKNYFYPDMPKDFQISQYDEPLCTDGYLDVEVDGETYRVGIERVHLEEDTGKTLHVGGATGRIHGADHSLVDYNRAGIPLVEIVTKPVPGTGALAPEVARAYVTELRDILRALGVSDVRMEQGSLRCDVNLSLHRPGERVGHPHRDQERQLAALGRAGGPLRDRRQAARAGRAAAGSSRRPGTSTRTPATPRPGRSKEEATDYRYFPEPDLVPLAPDAGLGRASCGPTLPELPARRGGRGCAASSALSDLDMQSMANAGVVELVEATDRGRAPRRPRPATGGWATWPGGPTRPSVELAALAITPAQVARVHRAGRRRHAVNDKLARQVVDGRAGDRRGRRRTT